MQYWMNTFNLSAKDASETLTAHMNKDKLEDWQRNLCDSLTVSDEIASATKSGDYMKITFAPDKHKMPKGECHATNHILTFDGNGDPIYDQVCKFSGWVMVDFKPDPIEVPVAQAGGVKAGRLIDFVTGRGSKKADRPAVPLRVFADKTGTKLAAWLGFEL
jgi:hypothetical protein